MKTIIVSIICILLVIGLVFASAFVTVSAEVVDVTINEVCVQTADGNEWAFYGNDFEVGQIVTLTMNTHFTNSLFDDSIINVW